MGANLRQRQLALQYSLDAAALAEHDHMCGVCSKAARERVPARRCQEGWDLAKADRAAAQQLLEYRQELADAAAQQGALFDTWQHDQVDLQAQAQEWWEQ